MEEVNINDAIEKLRSTFIKTRVDGMADLKHILSQKGRNTNLQILTDKGYHKIYEALFRVVALEKSVSSNVAKSGVKGAASRLSTCASVLRVAVEAGVQKLKQRTVKALAEHVTQTLTTSNAPQCEALCSDYIKSLRIILGYPPHVEHFPATEWQGLVDFCTAGVRDHVVGAMGVAMPLNDGNALAFLSPGASMASNGRVFSASGDSSSMLSKRDTEELIFCLEQLVTPTNVPLPDRAKSVLASMLHFLQADSTVGRAHQAAFSIVNCVLVRSYADRLVLVEDALGQLLPLIRRFWGTKSAPFKDEMLITLIHSQVYLDKLCTTAMNPDTVTSVEAVLDMLQGDYGRRLDRERLQLDDISFKPTVQWGLERNPLRTRTMYLRSSSSRCEQAWVLLQIIASLTTALDPKMKPARGPDVLAKRRRIASRFDDLLGQIKAEEPAGRLSALQALTFILERRLLEKTETAEVLNLLEIAMTDDDSNVSSWAMVALSSLSFQPTSHDPALSSVWTKLWQISARGATSPSTCRASCSLMEILLRSKLVSYESIAPIVETIFSAIDLNGPTTLVDSSLSLWMELISLRTFESSVVASARAERLLHWLFSKWTPARLADRMNLSSFAQNIQPASMLRFLSASAGLPYIEDRRERLPSYGTLAQAWLAHLRNEELLQYLLLTEDTKMPHEIAVVDSFFIQLERTVGSGQIGSVVLDYLEAEFQRAHQAWTTQILSSSNINPDMMTVLTSCCLIGDFISASYETGDTVRLKRLSTQTSNLTDILVGIIGRKDTEQAIINSVLSCLEPFLPMISTENDASSHTVVTHLGVMNFISRVSQAIESRRVAIYRSSEDDGADPMDLDDDFETQRSRSTADINELVLPRHESAAEASILSFCGSTSALLRLLTIFDKGQIIAKIPDSFLGYLTSLGEADLLSCRYLLKSSWLADWEFSRSAAEKLLVHIGQVFLQTYKYDRCEVAIDLCLEVMTGLTALWSKNIADDLAESSSELYHWFIDVALEKGILSPNAQKRIAKLLQVLLKIQPDYGRRQSLPSTRTSLFRVLNDGDISAKFYIADHVSDIFGLFSLTQHDAIFDDVLSSLPRDADWKAGIALRLFVLGRLASSWYTLLRRSVYHLFETPALITESASYAARCLADVSKELGLSNARELLRLFLPQILYTWLESQPVHSIPFSIFGYGNISDCLCDMRQEVVAQLVMRSSEDRLSQVAEILDVAIDDLIIESFDRVMAYSIARDISIPPKGPPGLYVGGETRVRKLLGNEKFLILVDKKFVEILAVLFKSIDQDEQIERAFSKRPQFGYAASILESIKAVSSSGSILPPNQQPCFRARFLLDEIDHLCNRTRYDMKNLWDAATLTYVLRGLVDTIHPALGSLHACSVIRRIRIVVCVAGDSALRDYPLEMLLHFLRPYITDTQCAEDAIGLVHYLLQAGVTYLAEVPSFVAGISLSIVASLKSFMSPPLTGTEIETHSAATMTKARQFHQWLTHFLLEDFHTPQLSTEVADIFRSIMRSALDLRGHGNAVSGTNESNLLREILDDERNGRRLLSLPSQRLALSQISMDFQKPPSYRLDIFGSNDAAAKMAVSVWKSCQLPQVGLNYLLWGGLVLGRAYVSTGLIPRELLPENDFGGSRDAILGSLSRNAGPKQAILKILGDLLLSGTGREASLTESTLRLVLIRLATEEDIAYCEQTLGPSLIVALRWIDLHAPNSPLEYPTKESIQNAAIHEKETPVEMWIPNLTISLAYAATEDAITGALPPILLASPPLAQQLFPFVLHIVLLREGPGSRLQREMSEYFQDWFRRCDDISASHVRILLTSFFYLRNQPLPHEVALADRNKWLDLDYGEAAGAAIRCRMFKAALLLVEIQASEASRAGRRSSAVKMLDPSEILMTIYQSIDEPDSFYGVQQQSSLSSVTNRLEYERDGHKSLSFRGAQYDSQLRRGDGQDSTMTQGMLKALGNLDLNGLSYALLRDQRFIPSTLDSGAQVYQAAQKLEQWDLPSSGHHNSGEAIIYRVLQCINREGDGHSIELQIHDGVTSIMNGLVKGGQTGNSTHGLLQALGILTEMVEILSSDNVDQLQETWKRMQDRGSWMHIGRVEDVSQILSSREILFGSLCRQTQTRMAMNLSPRDTRLVEAEALLDSSRLGRKHGALQQSLTAATYLNELIQPCKGLDLDIAAATQYETANVLWDQGEMAASIGLLKELNATKNFKDQAIHVGRAELLSKLGHQISEARLQKPDEIISSYLLPAIKELKGSVQGEEAGQVYHEFASFCDRQLQDADSLEEYQRVKKLRERKEIEVRELEKLYREAGSQSKNTVQIHRNKARMWYELDNREYQRLHEGRQAFLRQSLENYLLCLHACENHNNDVLRFCALWLEQSDSEMANGVVSEHLSKVPSRKFASLMNQLSSRLLDTRDLFQQQLFALVQRICVEHPFHSMYQIFSASKSRGKDEKSVSRHSAATKMASTFKKKSAGEMWTALHNTSVCYVKFALERLDEKYKSGSKIALRKTQTGQRLEHDVVAHKIPPATMKVELQADLDYSKVPVVAKFHSEFTVAGGVSAPKIVGVLGSNGVKYRQLVKGGNDDLRQDAIMEQVFEQVSLLLQNDRSTRQRNLGIRTYKVLPLTTNAGIIEFVPNTMPLHDFLMPAHQRHFPKDWKSQACRKAISDVQSKSADTRVKAYRQVTEHFHPVMRYFFTERFARPDDWFERRLAYSRSTAAISILGHVLGLGDRHCHNILLDEKTGEVVHIDLGVAFEQGRILPVPEVVPFRLTRDIVDGMGITRTEGVFRRCCEFTLEALRKESYSIMTVLDVLRYDPLYSWTVSPLRVKRQLEQQQQQQQQQQAQEEESEQGNGNGGGGGGGGGRERESNEPNEADRALTVVAKKLAKTLSVTATVNELIQQATDERNLAVLYAGWAAYA